ncbi:EAL domain-containing protein [Roseomonas gilardii subsp. gilardii]|uniref:bifunctional diguanylate cyclase/phosphodiesterase n=1 Tax=Roseomonas gilardii TaxID=257708 RepID=UPI001FFAA3E4|nr:EAL domain-containing protein [Roseomonas gilardii]UPG71403.1 EAL domain-containing protein [Roseomonas gilardii subsp. gilardii]
MAKSLALALAIAAIAFLLSLDLRERAIATGTRDLERLALALSEQADRAFQSIELINQSITDSLRERGVEDKKDLTRFAAAPELTRRLRDWVAGLPQIETIGLYDRSGHLVLDVVDGDRPRPPLPQGWLSGPAALEGRDRITSDPSGGPAGQGRRIWIGRRILGTQGDLLGFVLVAMPISYFEDFYAKLATLPGMAIALIHQDGALLSRFPPLGVGADGTATSWITLKPEPGEVRILPAWSALGEKPRLIVLHSLELNPLIIAVSRTRDALLQEWRQELWLLLGSALLAEAGVLGMALLGHRQLRNQARIAQAQAAESRAEMQLLRERERAEYDRSLQAMRFGVALDNLVQGVCMVDAALILQVANHRLSVILGLPNGTDLVGHPVSRLFAAALAGGTLTRQDLRNFRSHLRTDPRPGGSAEDSTAGRAHRTFLWELEDGRSLSVNLLQMSDGGWIATLKDVTARRSAEARVAHMALHDVLTDLPNRNLFGERLSAAVARARRGEGCALLYLDLDHFSEINDTLGHLAGDAVLRETAARLRRCLRGTDTVARFGGDEFAVLQTGLERPEDAAMLAERLIKELSLPCRLGGETLQLSVSLGIAVLLPGEVGDEDTLLRKADLALYQAKAEGHGCFRFFEPEMEEAMLSRRQLDADLRRALARQEFELFYQPILRLRTGEVVGFEALIRWRHPHRGLVSPAEFMPFVERSDLMVPIGAWVLEEACRQAAAWPPHLKMAVNLSATQFAAGEMLVEQILGALEHSGLPPDRLELEVTETVLLEDTQDTLRALHQLRRHGVRIALDDFGTGYSSLSYLRKFPFDKVKIDQSFVRDMGGREDCAAIVQAVISLGTSLGMITLAEGVETPEQHEMLLRLGCEEGQGYLFSPPRPAGEIVAMLAEPLRAKADPRN